MRIPARFMPFSLLIPLVIFTGFYANPARSHVVSEEDHHAFEHKYADVCVAREKANPRRVNTSDDSPLVALCHCIALEESKHLTSEEVRKFLRENKYPVSLMIKAGQAESICGTQSGH
ncbi:MAG: hypothetical protein ACR2HF_01445 [Methylococcaceae bacterium]